MAAKRRALKNAKKDQIQAKLIRLDKIMSMKRLPMVKFKFPVGNPGIGKTQLDSEVEQINAAIDARINKILSNAWEDQDLPFSQWYAKHGGRTE